MESWRVVWREGFAPALSLAGLEALRAALAADDRRLITAFTTEPLDVAIYDGAVHSDETIEGACAIGLCGWLGERLSTVGQVEEFFHATCQKADELLGEVSGCRWFINWFDDTPRAEVIDKLLPEVERSIRLRTTPPARRAAGVDPAVAEAF